MNLDNPIQPNTAFADHRQEPGQHHQRDIKSLLSADELFRVPFHSQTPPEALVGGVGKL